ncbi:hypothetical protein B4113_1024 [Geobacillus sp. B4113_201601]|nr:hypothetical protein B4113_1024 [Geobacillus sp. B4113_201601]
MKKGFRSPISGISQEKKADFTMLLTRIKNRCAKCMEKIVQRK